MPGEFPYERAMKRKKKQVTLTRMELEVMQAFWKAPAGPLTVREILDGVNEGRKPPLAYTTVQTVLMILKDKGVVQARPGPGRAHLFETLVTRDQAADVFVDDLVERLFAGRVQPLLHHLVQREALDQEELRDLKRFIDARLQDEQETP